MGFWLFAKKETAAAVRGTVVSTSHISDLTGPTDGDEDQALTAASANLHTRDRGRRHSAKGGHAPAAAAAAMAAPKTAKIVSAEPEETLARPREGSARAKRKHRKSKHRASKTAGPEALQAATMVMQAKDMLTAWREYQHVQDEPPPPKQGLRGARHRCVAGASGAINRVASHKSMKPIVKLHRKWREYNKPKRHTQGYRVDETGPEFPASLMDRASYMQLQLWARTHNVSQLELYALYERYRSHLALKTHPDGSRKLPNRMSLLYFQDLFDHGMAEATSLVLLPLLFVKETHGLHKPVVNFEIDFVRFVIAGYAFARCSPAGLVLKFFRLLLDWHMCDEGVFVTLRPFETLVALIHGGVNRPLLVLFNEAFAKRSHVKFVEMVRACVAMPPLLYPLFLFQRQFQRKFFNRAFWKKHTLPCMDPVEEDLFKHVLVPPAIERSLDAVRSFEDAWRLCARRLYGWVRMPIGTPSEYFLALKCDDCRDLDDDPPDDARAAVATAHLRQHFGFRVGKFVATLAFDQAALAPGALADTTWALFEEPLRCALEPGGVDVDPTATVTMTPRRRPVKEWPNPVAEDPHILKGTNAFLHRKPADCFSKGWTTLHDPQSSKDFYYHVASGESQWLDPQYDYRYGGFDGRRKYFSESKRRDAIDRGKIHIPGVTDLDPETGLPTGDDHMHIGGHRAAAVYHRARPGEEEAGNPLRPNLRDLAGGGDEASINSGVSSLSSGGAGSSVNPLKKAITTMNAFGKRH